MKTIIDLFRKPIPTTQSFQLQVISLTYSGTVTMFTIIDPAALEIWARIFMYITAGLLSLITIFYMIKNKGKGGKR